MRRNTLTADEKENIRADIDFHMAIAYGGHNTILTDMYESITCYLENQIAERNRVSILSTKELDDLHEVLFYTVEQGTPDRAVVAVAKILKI